MSTYSIYPNLTYLTSVCCFLNMVESAYTLNKVQSSLNGLKLPEFTLYEVISVIH